MTMSISNPPNSTGGKIFESSDETNLTNGRTVKAFLGFGRKKKKPSPLPFRRFSAHFLSRALGALRSIGSTNRQVVAWMIISNLVAGM